MENLVDVVEVIATILIIIVMKVEAKAGHEMVQITPTTTIPMTLNVDRPGQIVTTITTAMTAAEDDHSPILVFLDDTVKTIITVSNLINGSTKSEDVDVDNNDHSLNQLNTMILINGKVAKSSTKTTMKTLIEIKSSRRTKNQENGRLNSMRNHPRLFLMHARVCSGKANLNSFTTPRQSCTTAIDKRCITGMTATKNHPSWSFKKWHRLNPTRM
mmetsp:Transcript_37141/g.90041  ORF Transcript_37141/g.90041 Transcript_37141/m.90041 type:complete len:215 (-) Transcript_37141:881-1525(-)